ncbi:MULTISPECIES: hypothetical protein [Thermomonosporaceae]|uniref:hypothetical protein n=1 Tax=Thermomonosporaceae TaxID=2012 RepID=UPI00255A9D2E|nr:MULTISPECIES: hypothetical protein [Thermomonosporaceae]MDL4776828.1 hypothetical protein [Actinomadura xylanilytica]
MKTFELQAKAPLVAVQQAVNALLWTEAEMVFETSALLPDPDEVLQHLELRTFVLCEDGDWTVVTGHHSGEWHRDTGGHLSADLQTTVLTGWYHEGNLTHGWTAHENGDRIGGHDWVDTSTAGPATEDSWPDHGFATWGRSYTHTPLWWAMRTQPHIVLIAAESLDCPAYLYDL